MAIYFQNRAIAGKQLALALEQYKNDETAVIYALPRGGVVLGIEIAEHLNAPLTLLIARKIGHPAQAELAIGAVTENGEPLLNPLFAPDPNVSWLKPLIDKQRREAAHRRELYMKDRPIISAQDKTAIVIDDGIATGLTMRAALADLRAQHPKKLIVAVPMCPPEVAVELENESDELVVLDSNDDYLGSVGAYYTDFPQITDEEVVRILG